jgi:hypothetical protein
MELDGSAIDSLSCWAIVVVRWPCRPDRHELGKGYLLFKRRLRLIRKSKINVTVSETPDQTYGSRHNAEEKDE